MLYAAYGSNLNVEQMERRCPGAQVVAKSWIHDHRLVFQGDPFNSHANVIPEEDYEVPVVIWKINKAHERALDRYEGVSGGYYTKEHFSLEINGKLRECLIYIMTPNDFGIPTDYYLKTVADGYKDFNLDIRVLSDAVRYSYDYAPIL